LAPLGQAGRQHLAQLPGLEPRLLGQHHGRVGGDVAVAGVARRLDGHLGQVKPPGQLAGPRQLFERLDNVVL
jgi:hypothetical protein